VGCGSQHHLAVSLTDLDDGVERLRRVIVTGQLLVG
jgi:hypothetical protein